MSYGPGTVVCTVSKWCDPCSAGQWAAGGCCCVCPSEWRADVMESMTLCLKSGLHQSMCIHLKNNSARFHP